MSLGIYWQPVPVPPRGHELGTGFKYVVAPVWFNHDGSLTGAILLDKDYIPYLRGIRDASPEGGETKAAAQELIDAIWEHGTVKVWIGNEDE